jgi:hypothetical protein
MCYCEGVCGDGYCDEYEESSGTCPEDCEPTPGCITDAECPEELPRCHTQSGQCVECLISDDCPIGYTCDELTHTCESIHTPQECMTDADCVNIYCPQVPGMDTPKCNPFTGQCYCGGICGDGYCDTYEEMSNTCPEDCFADQVCFSEGERYEGFENRCCDGLTPVIDAIVDEAGGCAIPLCPCYICVRCPNGECGLGENYCNCPEDCALETQCESDQDCSDLMCPQIIGADTPKCNPITGTCYCGGECGDGYCDEYEMMSGTCPEDCEIAPEPY